MSDAPRIIGESRFDGTALQMWWVNLGTTFLRYFTLGIGYPWAIVIKHRFITRHTIVDGRRLRFDGTGAQLIGTWMKIWILSIPTLSIYWAFWGELTIQRWLARHTHVDLAGRV